MRRSFTYLISALMAAFALAVIMVSAAARAQQPTAGEGAALVAATAESIQVATQADSIGSETGVGSASGGSDLSPYAGRAKAAGFADLDQDAWYMRAPDGAFPGTGTLYIDYAVAEGLMSGYSPTWFAPDSPLTRGMAATIIYRMATGETAETADNGVSTKFPDVPAGRWYSAAVAWCSDNDVVTGYPETGLFEPDGKVTRAEIAAMVSRYCTQVEGMPQASYEYDLTSFLDLSDIEPWSSPHIAFCAGRGIMTGYGNVKSFGPQRLATRCQMAKIAAVTALAVKEYRASQVWEEYVPKYSYELSFIDIDPGIWDGKTDVYTDIGRIAYIKTDNPDPYTIDLNCISGKKDGEGFGSVPGSLFYQSSSGIFEDIAYAPQENDNPYQYAMHRVEGGYIAEIVFSAPGSHRIELREHRVSRQMFEGEYRHMVDQIEGRDYAVIGTTEPITVHDTDAEEDAWMNEVIEKAVAKYGGSSPKEIMDSVTRYLKGDFTWKYIEHRTGGSVRFVLSRYRGVPYFISHRCNSYSSPAFLYCFAKKIGGFEDVHNCYFDYVTGTKEWYEWHMYCRVTYQGEDYYYECCPGVPTGEVPTVDVDLAGGSNLIRLI